MDKATLKFLKYQSRELDHHTCRNKLEKAEKKLKTVSIELEKARKSLKQARET